MEWYAYNHIYEEHTNTWVNEILFFPFGICYSYGDKWFYHQLLFKFLGLEISFSISDW